MWLPRLGLTHPILHPTAQGAQGYWDAPRRVAEYLGALPAGLGLLHAGPEFKFLFFFTAQHSASEY